jgi:hypothetical protein
VEQTKKMTTEIRKSAPSLSEMIASFNPSLTQEQVEQKVKQVEVVYTVTDVTPAGYEPAE